MILIPSVQSYQKVPGILQFFNKQLEFLTFENAAYVVAWLCLVLPVLSTSPDHCYSGEEPLGTGIRQMHIIIIIIIIIQENVVLLQTLWYEYVGEPRNTFQYLYIFRTNKLNISSWGEPCGPTQSAAEVLLSVGNYF